MWNLASWSSCSLVILSLLGPLLGSQDNNSSVCVLHDEPRQCSTFCLAALHPLHDDTSNILIKLEEIEAGQAILKDSCGKGKSQQDHIAGFQTRQDHIAGFQTTQDPNWLATQSQLANEHRIIYDIIQESLRKTQEVEGRLSKTEEQLQLIYNSLQALLVKMERPQSAFQGASHVTRFADKGKTIESRFKKIGNRYFHIEEDYKKTWLEAADACNEMGGYLASIRDEEELNAISDSLGSDCFYWIGINDRDVEEKWVSVASGKPAQFLKWDFKEPNNRRNQDCVTLRSRRTMSDKGCYKECLFICQSDNEI